MVRGWDTVPRTVKVTNGGSLQGARGEGIRRETVLATDKIIGWTLNNYCGEGGSGTSWGTTPRRLCGPGRMTFLPSFSAAKWAASKRS